MNVGIIILNYLAYNYTIQCIESFLKQKNIDDNHYAIIVVDNCSENESYDILIDYFKNTNDIYIYRSDSNAGFANGNNYGYKMLKKIMDPDFVLAVNDDILFASQPILPWIEKCYKKYSFAVLGPQIYSINGEFHQNPMKNGPSTIYGCIKELLYFRLCIVKLMCQKILSEPIYEEIPQWKNDSYDEFHDDMTLHGSFLVFSKEYMNCYSDLFDPGTFLYMEENILKHRCFRKGLKMIFSPEYRVEHFQAVSSSLTQVSSYKKCKRRLDNLIRSEKVYVKELLRK